MYSYKHFLFKKRIPSAVILNQVKNLLLNKVQSKDPWLHSG